MQDRSVHDNQIIAYEVDGQRRRIILHTRYDSGSIREFTDVVFDGVHAYRFENDNFGNIILDIEEVSLAELLDENAITFEHGEKFGWTGVWNTSREASLRHLESKGAKAFTMSSSFGMDGWVISESYRLEEMSQSPPSSMPLQPTAEKQGG